MGWNTGLYKKKEVNLAQALITLCFMTVDGPLGLRDALVGPSYYCSREKSLRQRVPWFFFAVTKDL